MGFSAYKVSKSRFYSIAIGLIKEYMQKEYSYYHIWHKPPTPSPGSTISNLSEKGVKYQPVNLFIVRPEFVLLSLLIQYVLSFEG